MIRRRSHAGRGAGRGGSRSPAVKAASAVKPESSDAFVEVKEEKTEESD